MPVIDNDIFQIVTLVLLLLALLVSLVVLSAVGKIRRRLEDSGTGSSETDTAGWSGVAAAAPASTAQPAVASHPLEQTGGYEPAAAQPAAVSEPVAAQPEPAAAQPEPAAAQPAAAEPEDQPFERDGRWWFRRGGELLVYDESTGQWQPAPSSGAPSGGGTAQMPAAGGVATGTAEVGAHWKCPTCGAVNGSTAASCRMCFTPRP